MIESSENSSHDCRDLLVSELLSIFPSLLDELLERPILDDFHLQIDEIICLHEFVDLYNVWMVNSREQFGLFSQAIDL